MAQTAIISKKDQAKPPRSMALDGMKGLMMLTIIIYYYFQNYLPGGFLAVNAFFVFGGYLAFRHNQHTLPSKKVEGKLREKASRLWIPMVWMVIGTISFIYLVTPDALRNIRYMAISSLAFLNNDYQIFNQQSYFVQSLNPSPFIHLWYVSLYMQFLIVAVILRKIFARSHLLRMQESLVLLGLALLSGIGMGVLYWVEQDPSHVYYLLSTRIFAFLFGGMLSYFTDGQLSLKNDETVSARVMTQLLGVVSLVAMVAMMLFFNGTQDITYYFGMQVFTMVVLVFMVMGLYENTVLNYLLLFRGFTAIGRRSYSYYLWFYPVHLLAPHLLMGVEDYWRNVGIQFLILIILAEVSYRFFEIKQWQIPIGQTIQLNRMKQYWLQDRSVWKKMLASLFSVFYVVLLGISVVGMTQSVEGKSETEQALEDVIKRNQELTEQTTEETSTTMDPNRQIEVKEQVANTPMTFVGDSILLAAADKIQEQFPNAIIDGKVGRQLYNSANELVILGSQGKLLNTVVTVLGTNGTFSQSQLDNYINELGKDRDIYFVTVIAPVSWTNEVNQMLTDATNRFTNVHILDWAGEAINHPEWFYDDKIHPNNEGAKAFADFLLDEMVKIQLGTAS